MDENNDCELNISPQWRNFSLRSTGPDKNSSENETTGSFIDQKAMQMMQRMGYKTGSGLGKNEQGITEAIELPCHLGKRGLGLVVPDLSSSQVKWDYSKEEIRIQEKVIWLENKQTDAEEGKFSFTNITTWMLEGAPNHDIENECKFCDRNILEGVLKAKNIFDELDLMELCQARTKANPFETIKSVFFMNRAALKMANIDAATDFIFTNIDQNAYHNQNLGPYYFADVCAGPGGFSEYILWRKGWRFKGFGLTLKDENDFKLQDSSCAPSVTFQALYGAQGDGDVCCPENIEDFKLKVLHETDGKGVHFMMSDGGFSVEGKENIQEILSKNIYICQCLVALEVVRPHGHFVTKLFDTFTPFSVGLLYLMYKCFEKVAILKPNSSRPANSERYFICYGLNEGPISESIRKYLQMIVKRLWELTGDLRTDVVELVPFEVIEADYNFFSYITDSNNSLGKRQTIGLEKLAAFCRNPNLVEARQEDLRKKCLEFWKVPDLPRIPQPRFTSDELLKLLVDKPEILLAQPREVNDINSFVSTFSDVEDWHYCPMNGSRKSNSSSFFTGIDSTTVCRLQGKKWVKVKNLSLVKNTVLYGELVKEWNVPKRHKSTKANAQTCRYSLHVIDALRLADKNLTDLGFAERIQLLQTYCKAVNKESTPNSIRIRPKIFNPLSSLTSNGLLEAEEKQAGSYTLPLPAMGYDMFSEFIYVNSLLFLKTNENQSFHSTFVLRVQILVSSKKDRSEDNCLSLEDLVAQIKQKQ